MAENAPETSLLVTLITVCGGLAFLLGGMELLSNGLRKAFGPRLKVLVRMMISNRFLAIVAGTLLTVGLQSSSATSVLLVSFADASIISLEQALGMLLGAGIGTTLTVHVLLLKVSDYALGFVALGFFIKTYTKRPKLKAVGQGIMGFGMLFFGLFMMKSGIEPFRDELVDFVVANSNPLICFLIATLVTAVIQCSAVTIAIVISLGIPLPQAIPMVLGANVGTTATGLIASFGIASHSGRRVAFANTFFKLAGAVVLLPFLAEFRTLVETLSPQGSGIVIANAHLYFNLLVTLAFLPLLGPVAAGLKKAVPHPPDTALAMEFLGDSFSGTDEDVIDAARLELRTVLKDIAGSLEAAEKLTQTNEELQLLSIIDRTKAVEMRLDRIALFLVHAGRKSAGAPVRADRMKLLYVAAGIGKLNNVALRGLIGLFGEIGDNEHLFSLEGAKTAGELVRKCRELIVKLREDFPAIWKGEKINDMKDRAAKFADAADAAYRRHLKQLEGGVLKAHETSNEYCRLIENLMHVKNLIVETAKNLATPARDFKNDK